MNKWTGIVAGVVLILAACAVELAKQDNSMTSETRVLPLELRATRTPNPSPTSTPAPTPTPVHIRHFVPNDQELVEFVAQSSPRDSNLVRAATNIQVQHFESSWRKRILLVMGESPSRQGEQTRKPAAFAAVLVWKNAEYEVTFSHVASGRDQVRVSLWPDTNAVVFQFDDVSNARCVRPSDCEPRVLTHSCNVPLGPQALWTAHQNRQNPIEWGCF